MSGHTAFPGRLLAVVALLALTGCTGCTGFPLGPGGSGTPGPMSTTPTVVATSPSPTPDPAITAEDMLTAPVPKLCGHPAGRLTDGGLDGPGENDGGSEIAQYPDGSWERLSFRSWQGNDARQYAALVMDCNQGGVAWPPHVVFYGSGPTVLGQVDVADVVGNGRQGVVALAAVPDGVRLSLVNTYQEGEDGCCGTLDVTADFTWTGTRVQGKVVQAITEKPTAQKAFLAALKGDRAAITRLFTQDSRREALDFKDSVFIPDPNAWSTKFSCRSAGEDELFDGADRDYDRVCYFGAKDAYVAAFVAMKWVDFGEWKAAGVQFTSTD